jgi:hypothetical protein
LFDPNRRAGNRIGLHKNLKKEKLRTGPPKAMGYRVRQYASMRSTKGSLKNNFTFYTPLHPAWLRCESSEYSDIPVLSRLAGQAPQRLKL